MSRWRRKALETFPQLHREISGALSIGWVWDVLRKALLDTYRHKPLDEKFVADVYGYAHWCLDHRSETVRIAVSQWFYEDLCTDDELRFDLARWLSQEDFNRPEFGWKNILTEENLKAFHREFSDRKAELQGRASRDQRRRLRKLNLR